MTFWLRSSTLFYDHDDFFESKIEFFERSWGFLRPWWLFGPRGDFTTSRSNVTFKIKVALLEIRRELFGTRYFLNISTLFDRVIFLHSRYFFIKIRHPFKNQTSLLLQIFSCTPFTFKLVVRLYQKIFKDQGMC